MEVPSATAPGPEVPATSELLGVLEAAASAVAHALSTLGSDERRRPGNRPGQYHLDLVADDAACGVLHAAGLEVLSEESGRSGPEGSGMLVVVDPLDGSTNASMGIPWYATSLCVLDEEGPLVSLVVNQVSGARYQAVRGGGALCDGAPVAPSSCSELAHAVVGISGFPAERGGWAQFRALGSAALDLCCVATGALDGYRVVGRSTLYGWDYLGAMLVCEEAGAVVSERDGADLIVRDRSPRRPIAAATAALHAELAALPL